MRAWLQIVMTLVVQKEAEEVEALLCRQSNTCLVPLRAIWGHCNVSKCCSSVRCRVVGDCHSCWLDRIGTLRLPWMPIVLLLKLPVLSDLLPVDFVLLQKFQLFLQRLALRFVHPADGLSVLKFRLLWKLPFVLKLMCFFPKKFFLSVAFFCSIF